MQNHFLTFKWILYLDELDAKTQQPVRRIYKRIEQKAVAFVRGDPDNDDGVLVALKPRSNKSLLQDFLDLASAQNVEISKLVGLLPDPVVVEVAVNQGPTEEELAEQARREAELKAIADAIRKAEEDAAEAARKPLAFTLPPAYEQLKFPSQPNIFLGGISDDDFSAPIELDALLDAVSEAAVAEEPQAGAAPPAPVALTAEQLNALGKATFVRDEIHEQIFAFYEQVSEYFKPLVLVTVTSEDGAQRTVPHPSVFCVNDLQYLFENQYADVDRIKEALIHCFPLTRVVKTDEPQELWIQNITTGEFIPITKPLEFSIMGFLMQKEELGYVLHKCRPNSAESNARTTRQIVELFELCFARLKQMTEALRESRRGTPRRMQVAQRVVAADDSNGNGPIAGCAACQGTARRASCACGGKVGGCTNAVRNLGSSATATSACTFHFAFQLQPYIV